MKRKSIVGLLIGGIVIFSGASLRWAASQDAKATEVINKHLEALGGQKALGQVHDYTIDGTARVSVMGQGFNGKFTFTMKAPSRWRETFASPYYEGDSGCDGKQIWVVGEGQVRELGQLQQQIEMEFAGMKILTGPPRPGWTAKFIGQETLSEKETLVVELTAPSGRRAKYYLDAKTYLLVRSIVPAYNPMRRLEVDAVTDFQQYKSVSDLTLPHWIFTSNGFLSKEIEVSQWKFNTGPSDAIFVLPKSEKNGSGTGNSGAVRGL